MVVNMCFIQKLYMEKINVALIFLPNLVKSCLNSVSLFWELFPLSRHKHLYIHYLSSIYICWVYIVPFRLVPSPLTSLTATHISDNTGFLFNIT